MPQTYFERLITTEMDKIAHQTVAGEVKPGDADRHALACGKYQGLKQSLDIFRQAARTDEMETDRL